MSVYVEYIIIINLSLKREINKNFYLGSKTKTSIYFEVHTNQINIYISWESREREIQRDRVER